MGEEYGNIKADAASAENRHAFAGGRFATEQVEVGDHRGVIDTDNLGNARLDTGGDNHFVKIITEACRTDRRIELHVDTVLVEMGFEVANKFVEFGFVGHGFGEV